MPACDPILLPFLRAATDREASDLLGSLLNTHAETVIGHVLLATLGRRGVTAAADTNDVRGDVLLNLVSRLQDMRRAPMADPVLNFKHYVAVVAYNACYARLRARNPQRWRLKNRVRYALGHDLDLAIWEHGERCWIGGRREWRGTKPAEADLAAVGDRAAERTHGRADLAAALRAVFAVAGAPLRVDDLVDVVAPIVGVALAQPHQDDRASETLEQIADPRASAVAAVDDLEHLRALWDQIVELPLRQRHALLLNLRDTSNEGAIELFPLTGTASIRRIADALEIEHTAFAALWPRLPLEDREIAERLGLERQQVVNLRKSARARLARRVRAVAVSLGADPRR
jgi:hypothetical protein